MISVTCNLMTLVLAIFGFISSLLFPDDDVSIVVVVFVKWY